MPIEIRDADLADPADASSVATLVDAYARAGFADVASGASASTRFLAKPLAVGGEGGSPA